MKRLMKALKRNISRLRNSPAEAPRGTGNIALRILLEFAYKVRH